MSIGVDQIVRLLGDVLQLGPRAASLKAETPLLGNIPELDSMAVLNVIEEIERRFGITIDDDDMQADVFESVATLHKFVSQKAAG
jgi:acyl carrier protein